MKKHIKLTTVLTALAVALVAASAIAGYAVWTATTRIDNNSVATKTVTLTSFGSSASFTATGLIPRDQDLKFDETDKYAVSAEYEVILGSDVTSYRLTVSNLAGTGALSGKLYYKLSSSAAEPDVRVTDLTGWTELADGNLKIGADDLTASASATYYLSVILDSNNVADAGKTVSFTVSITEPV